MASIQTSGAAGEFLNIMTGDGPALTVGRYADAVVVRFYWSNNQPWYLTPAEADELSAAISESAKVAREYAAQS